MRYLKNFTSKLVLFVFLVTGSSSHASEEYHEEIQKVIFEGKVFASIIFESICLPTNYKDYRTESSKGKKVEVTNKDYDYIHGHFCMVNGHSFNETPAIDFFGKNSKEEAIIANQEAEQARKTLYTLSSWTAQKLTFPEFRSVLKSLLRIYDFILKRNKLISAWTERGINYTDKFYAEYAVKLHSDEARDSNTRGHNYSNQRFWDLKYAFTEEDAKTKSYYQYLINIQRKFFNDDL